MFLAALNFFECVSVKGHSAANPSRPFENPACFMAAFINMPSKNTCENLLDNW